MTTSPGETRDSLYAILTPAMTLDMNLDDAALHKFLGTARKLADDLLS